MNDYLDNLKKTDLRPKKIKVDEQKDKVLLEQNEVSPSDTSKDIERKIKTKKTFPVGGGPVLGIDVEESESRGVGDIHGTIIDFFKKNPNAKEEDIDKLSLQMGLDHDEVENHIFMMFGKAVKQGRITESKHLNEIFVNQNEIEKMEVGSRRDMAILRLSIIAELDAANLYERMADLTSRDDIRKVLLDVANEEKEHFGEFETLLEDTDPEHEKYEEMGEKEVEEII